MPRLGTGMPIVAEVASAPVLAVQDFFWLNDISGELTPIHTASRTNLFPYSEDFSNTAWSKFRSSLTINQTTSPDGTINAYLIEQDYPNTSVHGGLADSITMTSGVEYTYSFFIKKKEYSWIELAEAATSAANTSTWFDIENGVVGIVGAGSTAQIKDFGNGWYRCSISFTPLNTSSRNLTLYLSRGDGSTTADFGGGVYFWGAQLEQDSRASAYIPTSGSAVTVTTPLNDTHNAWDYDSANLTLEEDPDSEGSWERPSNVVLNHDFADLGAEILSQPVDLVTDFIVNGGGVIVDADTFDTFGGTYDGIRKNSCFTVGKRYKLTIQGDTTSSGFTIGDTSGSGNQYGSGFGTFYFTAVGNGSLWIRQQTSGTTNITSFTVKQVDPNDRWTKNTGWTISDGTANKDSGDTNYLTQDFSGNGQFKITYTISGYVSGNVRLRVGTGFSAIIRTSNGTYTEYITKDSASFGFYGVGEFSIDNVTVTEYAAMPLDV